MNTYDKTDTISFAKIHEDAIIPSRRDEDGCIDVYAAFDAPLMVLRPHEATLVPTGLISAWNPKYRLAAPESGSASKTNLGLKCGQIDSGYRGEWFLCIRNDNDIPVVITKGIKDNIFDKTVIHIPYKKALCQFAVEEVPQVKIIEETPEKVKSYSSERGTGNRGSSNK